MIHIQRLNKSKFCLNKSTIIHGAPECPPQCLGFRGQRKKSITWFLSTMQFNTTKHKDLRSVLRMSRWKRKYSWPHVLGFRIHGFNQLRSWLNLQVENLWLQRADCIHCTIPLYTRHLSIRVDFGMHGGSWNQPHGDTEEQLYIQGTLIQRRLQ